MGLTSYQTRLDFVDELGIYVYGLPAGIDMGTGEVFWELKSIDPETGEVPFDPFLGFLPPNEDGSEGQGYVTYSIKSKADAPSGNRIVTPSRRSSFDQNEPIDTPPIFNTLDAGPPESKVDELPEIVYSYFPVEWGGEDEANGSGIDSYDVYVSIDGSPFTAWFTDTEHTQAIYEGEPGHSYAFYSVARDLVEHTEAHPAVADAETTVREGTPLEVVEISVATAAEEIDVVFTVPSNLPAMIGDESIVEAVTLVDDADNPIALEAGWFSYDEGTETLTLAIPGGLADGHYELRLGRQPNHRPGRQSAVGQPRATGRFSAARLSVLRKPCRQAARTSRSTPTLSHRWRTGTAMVRRT